MQFTHERDAAPNSISSCSPGEVRSGTRVLRSSVILRAAGEPHDWPVTDAGALDAGDVAQLFDLAPDLVLLGTGERQVFPDGRLLAEFAARGIGFEVMDNRAACRTFNLLLQEGRDVVLALIFEEGSDPQGGSDPKQAERQSR